MIDSLTVVRLTLRTVVRLTLRLATVLAALTISACADRDGAAEISPSDAPAAQVTALERHCFRDVFGLPDATGEEDVLELLVMTSGALANGQYNWLPARKDRRIGTFDGRYADGLVEATYNYEQEGRAGEEIIIIELDDTSATVSGGPPELGLDGTITRVDCQ